MEMDTGSDNMDTHCFNSDSAETSATETENGVIHISDDAKISATWHNVSSTRVMPLNAFHHSSYVCLNPRPEHQSSELSRSWPPTRMIPQLGEDWSQTNTGEYHNQMAAVASRYGHFNAGETPSSRHHASSERKPKQHTSNILENISKSNSSTARDRLVHHDQLLGISHKRHLKNCHTKRKLNHSTKDIRDQMKETASRNVSVMMNSLTDTCQMVETSWKTVFRPSKWKSWKHSEERKESTSKQHLMKSTLGTPRLANAHPNPLRAISSHGDRKGRGHTCGCSFRQYREPPSVSSRNTKRLAGECTTTCQQSKGDPSPMLSRQKIDSPKAHNTSRNSVRKDRQDREESQRYMPQDTEIMCSTDTVEVRQSTMSVVDATEASTNLKPTRDICKGSQQSRASNYETIVRSLSHDSTSKRFGNGSQDNKDTALPFWHLLNNAKSDSAKLISNHTTNSKRSRSTDSEKVIKREEVEFDAFSRQAASTLSKITSQKLDEGEMATLHDCNPHTADTTNRFPFGFYHNDKLYVFVPPSPDKHDCSTPSPDHHKERTTEQKLTKQLNDNPLNIQSSQLMGTSEMLVNRLKDKSDKIPVVIVRPKKSTRKQGSTSNTTENRKTDAEFSSWYVSNKNVNTRLLQDVQDCSKNPLDGNTSISPKVSHKTSKQRMTFNNIDRYEAVNADLISAKVDNTEKEDIRSPNDIVTAASSVGSIELKDCFIDMGMRTLLPSSVTLDHQQRCSSSSMKISLNDGCQRSNIKSGKETEHKSKEKNLKVTTNKAVNTENNFNQQSEQEDSAHLCQNPVPEDNKDKSHPVICQGKMATSRKPRFSKNMASLVSEFLLSENKKSSDPKKDPITVVLQTKESKTVLMIPTSSITKYNLPIQLVTKESLDPSPVKTLSKKNITVTPKRKPTCNPPTVVQNRRNGVDKVKKHKEKIHSISPAPAKVTVSEDVCVPRKQHHIPADFTTGKLRTSAKKHRADVIDGKLSPVGHKIQQSHQSCRRQKANRSPEDNLSPVLDTLELQKNVPARDEQIIYEKHDAGDLFKLINQLYYAAGAQISTRNGLTVSRRAVFTICFTSQDPFLKAQQGVPGNLPAYLSFSKDHMVSMIFTSQLCSGFFLVQPTGIVKQDPNKPDIYVESAYLMPYSHRLQFPEDALFLVIGSLEEEWTASLTLANKLKQRASPDEVVEHFIGLEECRCFSASLNDQTTQSDDHCRRRELSYRDYQRHKHNLQVLSCRCRDCGSFAKSRRGKKKLSDMSSLSSDDEGILQNTSADSSNPVLYDSKHGMKLIASFHGRDKSEDESAEHHEHIEMSWKSNVDFEHNRPHGSNGQCLDYKSIQTLRNNYVREALSLNNDEYVRHKQQLNKSSSPESNYAGHLQHHNNHDLIFEPDWGQLGDTACVTRAEASRGSGGCCSEDRDQNYVVARERDLDESLDPMVTSPRKRKCDKMVVKMGFPFKKTARQSTHE